MDQPGPEDLHDAAWAGDAARVRELLELGRNEPDGPLRVELRGASQFLDRR